MSLLNDLVKHLHGVEAQVNPFDGGANYQSVVHPQQTQQAVQQAQPIQQGQPGQSYNPNYPMTPQIHALADIYNSNPLDPRVMHMDPAQFGYGPDPTAQTSAPTISAYQQDGINSISGRLGPFGGTIGVGNGVPFGSINRNGKSLGQFGPQD